MKLRPYEERAVNELLRLFRKHIKIVGVAPTGSGKTVIGAALIRAMKSAKRVLWIAHRVELLVQARQQLIEAGFAEDEVGILSGAKTINPKARVLVAGVAMFRTRIVPKVDLVVVDEAHHVAAASYRVTSVSGKINLGAAPCVTHGNTTLERVRNTRVGLLPDP